MKINIQPNECQYYVQEDKRKIVCIINDTSRAFSQYFLLNFANNTNVFFAVDAILQLTKQPLMPDRFVGIATCSLDDEWDEEKGKLIAYNRAKEKMNKSFFKAAQRTINELDFLLGNFVLRLNAFGEKCENDIEMRKRWLGLVNAEYTYPAVFDYAYDGISVSFPDLPGCLSCGDTDAEAIMMAEDALSGYLRTRISQGDTLPTPTPLNKIQLAGHQRVTLISVDL